MDKAWRNDPCLDTDPAIREQIERRLVQQEFIARGLRSADNARRTGNYIDADDVHTKLGQMLADYLKATGGKAYK